MLAHDITTDHELLTDRYWRGILLIFSRHSKLRSFLNTKYFDLDGGSVKVEELKKVSRPWSNSERFMLHLALHLFNERNKVNLSDMDMLDPSNKQLALDAIRYRFA